MLGSSACAASSHYHRGGGASSITSARSRSLFDLLCGPQEEQRLEVDPGLEISKQVPSLTVLPHGVLKNNHRRPSATGIPDLAGPDRCLSPRSNPPVTLEVSPVLCRGTSFLVQGTALWPGHCPPGLYKNNGQSNCISEGKGDSCAPLFG